ncbi:Uncharacterised protein [Candidatus Bartonella washoeensis]|uniref:hypothetical protein n=1 Tax=Candidatus Bartonella washoeensis TaxID=186739 RepID=UPI000D90B498|nr:Uncharacterised protein [Bartonella washoeensis]
MSDIYGWSLTASENAGADSFMNWCEGQPPHTVNNSARVMSSVSGVFNRYGWCS